MNYANGVRVPLNMQSTGGVNGAIGQFEQLSEQARVDNLKREQEIRAIFDDVINRYSENGTYKAGMTKDIENQKESDIGKQIQQMISSGIYSTSMPAGLSNKWESEVGTTARLKLEDLLQERVINAKLQKANFLNTIESSYPDYGQLASLAAQGANQGGGGFSMASPKASGWEAAQQKWSTENWGSYAPVPTSNYSYSNPTYNSGLGQISFGQGTVGYKPTVNSGTTGNTYNYTPTLQGNTTVSKYTQNWWNSMLGK
jgi:hypothetical protein